MTDQPFVHAWLRAKLAAGDFHHRDHLRLAWMLLDEHGPERAGDVLAGLLRDVAEAHGQPERYHETLTRFWLQVVIHVRERRPDLADLDAAASALPLLLDKDLPFRHWSRPAMATEAARRGWLEPDLAPLAL
jgi:hypothetical protein